MSREEFAIDPSPASKGFNPHAAERASVWMYSEFAKRAYAAASAASLFLTAASAASLSLFNPVMSVSGLGLGSGLELGLGLGLLLGC